MQFYSDPTRESSPTSLPDCEVFHASYASCPGCDEQIDTSSPSPLDQVHCDGCNTTWHVEDVDNQTGYWYWFVYPGCVPDSDPIGPFATSELAITSCRKTWN